MNTVLTIAYFGLVYGHTLEQLILILLSIIYSNNLTRRSSDLLNICTHQLTIQIENILIIRRKSRYLNLEEASLIYFYNFLLEANHESFGLECGDIIQYLCFGPTMIVPIFELIWFLILHLVDNDLALQEIVWLRIINLAIFLWV